ncbi:MAG: gylcosyl transferase-like protein [Planctomycetaceae bacterium]|nr:gylcosyl transferase-like protein [Planctomycetaceae bacterium]
MTDKMRVLILAPGCDGTDVGESWSCCQWVRGLAEHCDITLLTLQRPGRTPMAQQLPNVEVVSWNDIYWGGRLERFSSMLKPGYFRFYRNARRWIRTALKQGRTFDVMHQLGPLALRYPSPAVGFKVPLIIGPLAGSLETPPAFQADCGKAPWYTRLRNLDQLRLKFDPWLRNTYRSADVVIGVAPYVKELLKGIPLARFEVAAETGVHDVAPTARRLEDRGPELRLLYVGRVIRTKGLRDLVQAMSLLADVPNLTLDAVGMGEDLAACRELAVKLNLEHRVRFHGRLPRADVETMYAQADVFVFPSFREPSGNVVFEALSHGLPVITTDRGGPGYVVDDESGIRVAADNPAQLAQDLASAIRRLAADAEMRDRLAKGAAQRARQLALWSNKINGMVDLYRNVIQQPGTAVKNVMTNSGSALHIAVPHAALASTSVTGGWPILPSRRCLNIRSGDFQS